jgi:hypothetical protein
MLINIVLQNPSQYKMRPKPSPRIGSPVPIAPKGADKNLHPLLTKEAAKRNIVASPLSANESPYQDQTYDLLGMERAYTFAVEGASLGWNLMENNARQDPIPPEPVALNEARLLCREAMTLITEEVS